VNVDTRFLEKTAKLSFGVLPIRKVRGINESKCANARQTTEVGTGERHC